MKGDFEQQFQSKGFTILGWGDVGAAKTMSIGFEIHRPADLQGKNCFFIAGDPIGPSSFRPSGASTPKRSPSRDPSEPEERPHPGHAVPPLAAEQLQWASV